MYWMSRKRSYAIAVVPLYFVLVIVSTLAQNCGRRKVPNMLIVNGTESRDGHWPWHVAIFYRNSKLSKYRCGGTILDQNTILTAAHCLHWIYSPKNLVVQAGRNRLRVASHRTQEHEVSEIIVHPNYKTNSLRHDIALIKLATDITYTDYIQPICLWNRGEDQNAIVGSLGTVVGFGTDETDNLSNTLREARISVVSAITCLERSREVIAKQLTSDMFCGGNRDGIVPCDGDSGGGLYFNYNNVWFIRGLLSFTPTNKNTRICDTNEYTVFTDVAKYLEWIKPKLEWMVATSVAQSCGKRKVSNFLLANGTEAKDGYWPWHVAIFRRVAISLNYTCGGTILDQNTVLTVAHCLSEIKPPQSLVVQVGRNRLHVTSHRAQEHEVSEIIVHPNYKTHSVRHDIALIKLATDISYTDYIQPICLWNRGEDQNAIVGSLGTVVGFGTDETDNLSNTLREARLPVVSAITCIKSNRDSFATQLTSDMFCAGNRNGVGACNGDSGGGFFFNYNGVWYIRGLVSFTSPREGSILCDTKEYIVFTDVAKYLEWIEQSIGLDSAPTLEQYCGKRKMPAKDGYWPWHVALFYYNPAHCLMTSKGIIARNSLVVKVGLNRESTAINHALDYEPFELIVHPEYNINSSRHDIADITYTDYIQPICLLDQGEDQNAILGSLGTVISYTTDTLREAHLPIVSANTCIESNRNAFTSQLFPDIFCAGNRDGIEPNTGDAGGGFFFNYSDTWFIRGVVSFTPPRQHAATKEYTVFTDVSKYFKWIKKHMRETSDQPTKETSDTYLKFGLLPMSTCGENPYASWEELSKPVLLGYPWVGLLEYTQTGSNRKIMICQATLISDLYLITSASCIKRLPRGYTLSSVRLGEYNQNTMTDCAVVEHYIVCSPPVQTLLIERVITHTRYNKPQYANDIALIRLRDRADTSQCNVKPICLPVTNKLRSQKSTHYTLTSWFFGNSGNLLERSERELIDTTKCQQLYNDPLTSMKITTRQICIRQQQENHSECELFKEPLLGAPLQLVQQVRGDSRYVLHGVLSYGPNICGTSFPNVFTNVASYVDWILENMEE